MATSGDLGPAEAGPDQKGPAAAGVPGTAGISLSGGGVRAAAYGLGVLQAMGERQLLTGRHRARYLSAVSGGSYIAGAVTLVARGAVPGEPDAEHVVAATDPFGRGTPEEQYVRRHTTYLTHGPGGPLAFLWRLLGGIVLNLAFLALVLHAVFRPAGWLYGRFFPSLREGYAGSASTPTPAWLTVVILALVGAGALAGLAAIGHRWQDDGTRHLLARTCQALVGAGVVLAMVAVGVPKLIEVVRDVVGQLFQERDHKSAVEAAEDSARALGVSGGASLAGVIGTALWAVKARVADPTTVDQARRWIRRFRRLRRGLRRFIMSLAATLFGPLLLLSGALAFLSIGALNTPLVSGHGDWAEVLWWALPLLALALMWLFGDLQAWSLQPLYKRRLSDTFALRRVRRPGKEATAEPRPYSTWYLLSQSQPEDFPQLLVCAAANVNDYGATPTGSDVGGFVLSPTEVGGPLTGTVQTAVYEEAFGDRARDFTLPAAVGITGAAFSPAMGKMTRAPIRFLLALLNLRLGVWLPNPRRCEGSGAPAYRRFVGGPKLLYLIREMLGRHSLNDNYLYVSDGGHYENLGLVELLRRGCTTVWCVDATGERIDSFGTIGEAVQIARSELSVDVDLVPDGMGPDPEASGAAARFVRRTHAVGTIRYRNGVSGHIVVIKAGVPPDAPLDVRTFHQSNPAFPCDPTSNQLFEAERFDAYRALGYFSAERALDSTGVDGGPLAPPRAGGEVQRTGRQAARAAEP